MSLGDSEWTSIVLKDLESMPASLLLSIWPGCFHGKMWDRSNSGLGLSMRLTILLPQASESNMGHVFSMQLETCICQCLSPKQRGLLLTQEDPGSVGRFLLERRHGEHCPQSNHWVVNLNSKVPFAFSWAKPSLPAGWFSGGRFKPHLALQWTLGVSTHPKQWGYCGSPQQWLGWRWSFQTGSSCDSWL